MRHATQLLANLGELFSIVDADVDMRVDLPRVQTERHN
jgi:hypothetical protein|tara:strand:+ start:643 stop:756 length:114 start_codon:yes stop_codon:yes gene_type:complete